MKTGDRIELELPLTTRLEAIDQQHPETVAVLVGPIVLFAITESQPALTRAQLMAVKKSESQRWHAETASGSIMMLPFTAIKDEAYTTYLRVS